MGTKYPGLSIVNYNATPPSDDGVATANNQVTWGTHTAKIGDPLKTAIDRNPYKKKEFRELWQQGWLISDADA